LSVCAITALSVIAQPGKPIMKDMSSLHNPKNSLHTATVRHLAASEPAEETTWGDWQLTGTGTFTIDDGLEVFLDLTEWTGSFAGINVYSRTATENKNQIQYKFEKIYNDVDIVVDYDASTALCKVLPQPTNIEAFDMPLDVADFGSIFELYGEEWLGMTPEEVKEVADGYASYNYFVPELGRFYLYLGYLSDGMDDVLAITDCTFQLDQANDMTVSINADAFYKDATDMKCTIKFPESVGECRYGCFEGILTQNDLDAVLSNAAGVKTIEKPGEVALEAQSGPGMYIVVAVTFSSNGAPIEWDYKEYTYTPSSNEGWTSLGKGTFKTDMFESLFELDIPSYQVEVERNIENPSIYRVVNPYGESCPYPELSLRAEDYDIYLVFDATDPEKVFFRPTNLGIDTGGGWWIACNNGYFIETFEGKKPGAGTFGKLADGVISFPAKSVVVTCEEISIFGGEDGSWYYGNGSGTLSLNLPDESAVESVMTAKESMNEYFNMQGVRLSAPQKGTMVIERNGSNVSKKVIR
ncbi:MAG: hypothetical protein K2H22_01525, partial [Muribaculaceae bacterium]|nr:hypothetical protein [Muribaculaceae bacterium]